MRSANSMATACGVLSHAHWASHLELYLRPWPYKVLIATWLASWMAWSVGTPSAFAWKALLHALIAAHEIRGKRTVHRPISFVLWCAEDALWGYLSEEGRKKGVLLALHAPRLRHCGLVRDQGQHLGRSHCWVEGVGCIHGIRLR